MLKPLALLSFAISIVVFNSFSVVVVVVSSPSVQFDLGTLTLTSLKLIGDAHLDTNGSLRLTRDLPVPTAGAGRVLYSRPVRFRSAAAPSPASFSTFFSFSVVNLNPSSIGAGLAFLLSPDSTSLGLSGGSLGLAGAEDSTSAASGFVAVEFDTLMDVEFGDINGNHVGIDLNTVVSSEVGDLATVGIDLKSGDLVNAWIDYDGPGQVMNVSVSYSNLKPRDPILSMDLDLDRYVSDFMFVGFSGSTQGSTEVHTIQWWTFTSGFDYSSTSASPPPPPATSTLINSASSSSSNSSNSSFFDSNSNSSSSDSVQPGSRKDGRSSPPSTWQGPGAVAGVATGGVFLLAAVFGGGLIWFHKKRKTTHKVTKKPTEATAAAAAMIKTPREFNYKELKQATRCFNATRVIGHGAFGTVYKGILPDSGDIIAVKRCSHGGDQGKTEFLSELSIIGTLRHRNLVRLQGWCHEKGEILLVYELMPNGSLDKALFESRSVLPWAHRRKILLGVASALAYLHQECDNLVIHRDVKSSNIMLDEGFNARLGDFGLAREIEHDKSPDATVAAGTMGYLAPEYLLTGRASDKTDVFSFGAVVLEVASGRRPIERDNMGDGSGSGCRNLVEWVWGLHRDSRLLTAADGRLNREFEEAEMRRVLLVGLACSHPDPLARPPMRAVVQMLVGEADVPVVPQARPSTSFSTSHLLMTLQDSVSDCNAMITISSSSSLSSGSEFDAGNIV